MTRKTSALVLVIVLIGCGSPSPSSTDQDLGKCIGEGRLHPFSQSAFLERQTSWWTVDVAKATTGRDAGRRRPDDSGPGRQLDGSAFSAIVDEAGRPSDPFYIHGDDYSLLRALGSGRAIMGSVNRGGEDGAHADDATNSISVAAVVDPDGSLRFVGDCATKQFTETFADYVEGVHPEATAEAVLLELISSGDFSSYDEWLNPTPTPWIDRDPRSRGLDPDATPKEVLDSLVQVVIEYHGLFGWNRVDATVCPWTSMGWNSCVWLGGAGRETALRTVGYLVPGEDLELWFHVGVPELNQEPTELLASIRATDLQHAATVEFHFQGQPQSTDELLSLLAINANVVVVQVVDQGG